MSEQSGNIRRFEQHSPRLGSGVLVDPSAVLIGDIEVGDDCSLWPQVTVRADVNSVRIGARTSIQDGSVLHVTHAGPHTGAGFTLEIGEDVTVGHKVTLHGCRVGNRVLVGIGSIVMEGAVIEDEVVLGANSLVPPGKTLASGYLYVGSPARQVRALSAEERENLSYSAQHYVRLKDRHLAERGGT